MPFLCPAKALGHFSPYGTYWAALSLINDRVNPDFVEKLVSHVERWSRVHTPLLPRFLHLRAEIMSQESPHEVRELSVFYSLQAVKLFDQAAAEAERLAILDCVAFINERFE
jgi:hypothetical protein